MKVKFTGQDFNVLLEHGYRYSSIEGGWISADIATIVSENRSPYQREIEQFNYNYKKKEHEKNISTLIAAGLAEYETEAGA